MVERLVEVRLDDTRDRPTIRRGLSANEVVEILRALEGKPDVTATISLEDSDERLLVAVSGTNAFLGLDSPDGIFQFVSKGKHSPGTRRLIIGSQPTDIDSRSVVCVETAARVAEEWLKGGRESSLGVWERQ
jgi:hypothetical protein